MTNTDKDSQYNFRRGYFIQNNNNTSTVVDALLSNELIFCVILYQVFYKEKPRVFSWFHGLHGVSNMSKAIKKAQPEETLILREPSC